MTTAVRAESREFKDFLHGLQGKSNEDPISAEVTEQEATPISHNRRKRYMSFRPLFVYRLQAAESRQNEYHKEAKRLHSTDFNMENNYDYWILPTDLRIPFNHMNIIY